MNDKPFFTVIIPQKNRAEYLVHTLRTCMIQDYPNFEVIVSDDCSDDDSVKVAEELSKIDSRIKVFAHDHHLGMHDNFEFALNQVKPGYVMALGGDDGLTPGCITRMWEILRETKKELLTWTTAMFTYPNERFDFPILSLHVKHKPYVIKKSKDYLVKISKGFHYMTDDCPMFYIKGVASTALVERVKSRTPDHSFYYCPTPDGFSGVVLAGEVDEYVMAFEPLSIGGTTTKSQGQNYHRTDSKSKAEAEQFFQDNVRRVMHRDLASQPYSPLGTLMTVDYLLTAKDLPGWPASSYFSIDFAEMLKESFRFISNSSFERNTLVRELGILKEIAKQHNLLDLFNQLYSETKLHVRKNKFLTGFAFTNEMVRFAGDALHANNIYDASLAIPYIYNFHSENIVKTCFKGLWTDFKLFVNRFSSKYNYKNVDLPEID